VTLEFFFNRSDTAHFFTMLLNWFIMTARGLFGLKVARNFKVGSHVKNSYNVIAIVPEKA